MLGEIVCNLLEGAVSEKLAKVEGRSLSHQRDMRTLVPGINLNISQYAPDPKARGFLSFGNIRRFVYPTGQIYTLRRGLWIE